MNSDDDVRQETGSTYGMSDFPKELRFSSPNDGAQAIQTFETARPESLVLTTRGSRAVLSSTMIYATQTLSSFDRSIARDQPTSRFGGVE